MNGQTSRNASIACRRFRGSRISRRSELSIRYVQSRSAATLASSTAINAPRNVPPEYRDLYQSLQALKDTASDFVNQSRLQLALRGLESAQPTIRIGILGLGRDGEATARKLARVLLADPLGDKQAWEDRIVDMQRQKGTMLLRYGQEEDSVEQSSLIETLHVPSRVLQKNNLEVLISSLNLDAAPDNEVLDAILVPPLQTPIAASGRAGYVRYPVHKALLVGEGIDGCMAVGRLWPLFEENMTEQSTDELVMPAINLPYGQQNDHMRFVDVNEAKLALDLFRDDVSNGPVFSHKWQSSGMPALSQWLIAQQASSSPDLDAAVVQAAAVVRAHIQSVLLSAQSSVATAEEAVRLAIVPQTIPESTRTRLQDAISKWAQLAHTDLQQSLESATASRSWRRTSWYKLLWRADDVGVAAEDVLRSHWLLEAEAGLAFLSGRVEEAGFFRTQGSSQSTYNRPSVVRQNLEPSTAANASPADQVNFTTNLQTADVAVPLPSTADLVRTPQMLDRVTDDPALELSERFTRSRQWPQAIHTTRQTLLHTLVPALQSRAQTLLLQSLSTIGGTSALGAWFYAATYGAGLYEGGAIAALGLVWSFRRLQRKWEEARSVFAGEVRESGRVVLAEVEGLMRGVVRDHERPAVRKEDEEAWQRAREAVREAGEQLRRLK